MHSRSNPRAFVPPNAHSKIPISVHDRTSAPQTRRLVFRFPLARRGALALLPVQQSSRVPVDRSWLLRQRRIRVALAIGIAALPALSACLYFSKAKVTMRAPIQASRAHRRHPVMILSLVPAPFADRHIAILPAHSPFDASFVRAWYGEPFLLSMAATPAHRPRTAHGQTAGGLPALRRPLAHAPRHPQEEA